MSSSTSSSYRLIAGTIKKLAQCYVKIKKPTVIAVAGSVGKTSTKLMLAHMLQSKKISFMDDSYNNGLGLYLSVFERKVPTNLHSPLAWLRTFGGITKTFISTRPDILILEYGIDHPGDMDAMVAFIRPDISLLTAVTPEHMEYMKTLDGVAEEETKVLQAAKQFALYNTDDVAARYITHITTPLATYGSSSKNDLNYSVQKWTNRGAQISIQGDLLSLKDISVHFVSEPLIRQLVGATLLACKLGIEPAEIRKQLQSAQPAASRMRLFDGINDSTIIDDTTNFSPDAGVEALKALKRIPAKRHIAILGNMHELGDYADKGFKDVAEQFEGLDIIALVGDLSREKFSPHAKRHGFTEGETLFYYDTSVDAGIAFRSTTHKDDIVLVKGPFGGFYLEETVKKLLKNKNDEQYLTRQSDFWQIKKQQIFHDKYSQ